VLAIMPWNFPSGGLDGRPALVAGNVSRWKRRECPQLHLHREIWRRAGAPPERFKL
jgi:acyl-CoA reductase-like NAD-dependent aldehyde dehydrogenase